MFEFWIWQNNFYCLVQLSWFISADVGGVGVARTPMGGFLGSLSSLPATKLGSIAISSKITNFSSIYQFGPLLLCNYIFFEILLF